MRRSWRSNRRAFEETVVWRRLIVEQEQEKQEQVVRLKRVFEEETVGWRGFNETEGFVRLNDAILKAYILRASKKP